MKFARIHALGHFILTFVCSAFSQAFAFAQAPYYQNKTIKIIRGGEPGGTGDLQARALIPFPEKTHSRQSHDHRREHAGRRGPQGSQSHLLDGETRRA